MKKLKCPNCGHELRVMCVIGADRSNSGYTERWCHCEECCQDWETYRDKKLKKHIILKKFWG